jgi:hypothetical protein
MKPLTKTIGGLLWWRWWVVGSDDGSISGKGIVAVSGKALIGSTGTGAE